MQILNRVRISRSPPLARWLISRSSSTKLFVGVVFHPFDEMPQRLPGMSYDTNETSLKDAFEQFGEIIEVKVICDHVSGKSKGYGFVNFTSEIAASKALEEMKDKELDGRSIRVQYALTR